MARTANEGRLGSITPPGWLKWFKVTNSKPDRHRNTGWENRIHDVNNDLHPMPDFNVILSFSLITLQNHSLLVYSMCVWDVTSFIGNISSKKTRQHSEYSGQIEESLVNRYEVRRERMCECFGIHWGEAQRFSRWRSEGVCEGAVAGRQPACQSNPSSAGKKGKTLTLSGGKQRSQLTCLSGLKLCLSQCRWQAGAGIRCKGGEASSPTSPPCASAFCLRRGAISARRGGDAGRPRALKGKAPDVRRTGHFGVGMISRRGANSICWEMWPSCAHADRLFSWVC